jgi:SAM-dependent methyltransferase
MHASSYRHMRDLVDRHLVDKTSLRVADLGSQDVNGSYRPLFARPGWRYVGIDLAAGENVDVVLSSPYRVPLPTGAFDVVVSGQAFEHVEFFWLTWLEMARLIKPGGLILLIAPSRGPEHRYPVDCWRFYPDGYAALARYAGLELIEAGTDWAPAPEADSAPWGDTVGVFRKPKVLPVWQRLRSALKCRLSRLLAT